MAIDVRVPEVGESITEGTLARWLKNDGDSVKEGDAIFELETDKATGEVPAPASGRLKIEVKEGTTVNVGSVVALIEGDGVTDHLVDAGRVSRAGAPMRPERVESHAPQLEKAMPAEAEKVMPAQQAIAVNNKLVIPASAGSKAPLGELERAAPANRVVRKPMSRLRKTIADRLVSAQHSAAILTTFNEADMSQIVAIRNQFRDDFEEQHGVSLGFMSFFIKASIEGLKSVPIVNARIEGSDIVEQDFCDIGVAVSTERGLMVPVIRNADRLRFEELEKAVEEFAVKARNGTITVDDLQGGTFTITNGGVFGSLLSTPILNPPQSAILGMHAIQKRPVAVDDKVEIRPMMYLALSYDHRLIDGREAVLFLRRIKECVENPVQLLWGI